MLLEFAAVLGGLVLLVWSADKFIDGAALSAKSFGLSPLLIGMFVVGFGTSAPEIFVSAISSIQGEPELAIGNAYGSNITNIALVIGFVALVDPIDIHSLVLKKELPLLVIITLISAALIWDLSVSRVDASLLLLIFIGLLLWSVKQSKEGKDDILGVQASSSVKENDDKPLWQSLLWLIVGLVLLIVSSRILVWGAVGIAKDLGVSNLVIGLTILAIGTSLPELASSIAALKKDEDDIALGNIVGSNMFNTLCVVGIAGVIEPINVQPILIYRDVSTMLGLTLLLLFFGYGFITPRGRLNRLEGGVLLLSYFGYNSYLLIENLGAN